MGSISLNNSAVPGSGFVAHKGIPNLTTKEGESIGAPHSSVATVSAIPTTLGV